MTPAAVILSVLLFTSTTLCIAMLLAWLHFGRQRHALTWAIAYGGGALQWAINAVGVVVFPGHPLPLIITSTMILANSALVVIGCRQRAGLPERYGRFAAVCALAAIPIALGYTVIPNAGLPRGLTNLFVAAMMSLAIAAIRPERRKARAPEKAFAAILALFCLYETALGVAGFAIGANAAPQEIDLYRTMVILGLPPVYIGVGIAALFLLAGDLAESVRSLVTRDPLTGSLNRRGIEQAAIGAIANARRHGRPLALVMADVDRFKVINDRFGHAAGDRALATFADHVQASVREEDLFGRMGGDEFCLLLIDATAADAAEAMERTRRELEVLEIECLPGFAMTASFGISEFEPGDVGFGDMVSRADLALYDSKVAGRNRVSVWDVPRADINGTVAR